MEIKRLFDFIYHQKDQFPLEKAFGGRRNGDWYYYSTDEVIRLANQVSCGLLEMGVQPGERIAVAVYQNRPEWVILDLGIQQIGAVNVPVYPTISPSEYEYIFNDSEVTYCFVGRDDLYDKVTKAQEKVPTLKKVFTFDKVDDRPFWEEVFRETGLDQVKERMAAVQAEDLATIIYTSGTTGKPKGVMLSHRNIVSNVRAVQEIFPIGQGEKALSFLPICHIFERTASYNYTFNSISVTFAGTDNLGGDEGDLKAIQPHFFTTVPRLLEKVYEKIVNKGLELSGVKRKLFFWALGLTEDYVYDYEPKGLKGIQWTIADKLIFSKWRDALGGQVKGILSGAAPLPTRIAQVFSAAGIPIREGYGLTETSPGLAIGRYEPGGAMLGAIGPALSNVELMIDEDKLGIYGPDEGEVLARGENIMMGYYKNEEATAEVTKDINGESWFCTGDIGKMIPGPDGTLFLKITDRKKELLKTSGGKYVAPAPIENKLKEHFLIEQIMVVGEGRKFVSALIVPGVDALQDWCKSKGITWSTLEDVLKHPKVVAKYEDIIAEENPQFSHIEQIKKFQLLPVTWDPIKEDGSIGELTPTLKLKRRVIREKYDAQIAAMYDPQAVADA